MGRLEGVRQRRLNDVLDLALWNTLSDHRDERGAELGAKYGRGTGGRTAGHGVHDGTSMELRRL
jgi:hypothetical protein